MERRSTLDARENGRVSIIRYINSLIDNFYPKYGAWNVSHFLRFWLKPKNVLLGFNVTGPTRSCKVLQFFGFVQHDFAFCFGWWGNSHAMCQAVAAPNTEAHKPAIISRHEQKSSFCFHIV